MKVDPIPHAICLKLQGQCLLKFRITVQPYILWTKRAHRSEIFRLVG